MAPLLHAWQQIPSQQKVTFGVSFSSVLLRCLLFAMLNGYSPSQILQQNVSTWDRSEFDDSSIISNTPWDLQCKFKQLHSYS